MEPADTAAHLSRSRMEPTRAAVMRATKWSRVLSWGGYVWGSQSRWRSVGFLTALVTLFSWRKQSSVFVDRVCVNQFDPQMKVEGIISLGAILKSSSSMLVIWDESYVERLWCLFELAAFLKAHEEEAGRSERNGRSALRVKPLSLGWICVITSCALSVLSFHILVTPTDDSLMEWVIRLSCLTMLYTFIAVSRAHFRAMESAQQQLQCFRLEDATCWCCTVNHIDQDGPFTTCDRECVTKCILSWFGSTESFEQSVQSSVAKALSQQLGAGKGFALPLDFGLYAAGALELHGPRRQRGARRASGAAWRSDRAPWSVLARWTGRVRWEPGDSQSFMRNGHPP
ncbi:Uncharacterized protein SCF082_LOCUS22032 [Durusdinium trenchii]|uniref:TIR domain-containing protein n=1 Tax=Durusdinium trenchii TaxID=1381693 RepID=A0ABP0LDB5_9DINO